MTSVGHLRVGQLIATLSSMPKKHKPRNRPYDLQALSPRHELICIRHALGETNKSIAERLGVSKWTVSNTLNSIIAKEFIVEVKRQLMLSACYYALTGTLGQLGFLDFAERVDTTN